MVFQKVNSADAVTGYLTSILEEKLAGGQQVLWLIPGGSAIEVAAAVSQRLQDIDLSKLTVTLTDERYGPVGHHDSNWLQLAQAGLSLPGARLVPVLHGHSVEDTTAEFARHLQEYCQGAAYCLGFFGMGADGHTAGILPDSPAVLATEWAASYQGPDFMRITMTPPAIAALDEAVVYAMGEAKLPALQNLRQEIPLAKQPAQALKKIKQFTIFNDQTGETT